MKYNKLSAFFSFIFISLLSLPEEASARYIGLKEAMQKDLVSVCGVSNGGYMGKALTLNLRSNSSEPLDITVNPGLIFTPADTNYQNLVALGGEFVSVEPYSNNNVKLQTFCGKSYAHSPARGINYDFWRQGDSNMVKTMAYMRQHNIIDHLGQSAVWTYTNGHCLSTVCSPYDMGKTKQLVRFIADQQKKAVPKFFTYYELNNTPGATTVIRGSGIQYVDVFWATGTGEGNMYVNVYKEDGSLYKQITGDEVIDPAGHTVLVKFNPDVEKGFFYVVVEDDHNNVWMKKEIAVGADWCNYSAMN